MLWVFWVIYRHHKRLHSTSQKTWAVVLLACGPLSGRVAPAGVETPLARHSELPRGVRVD